MVVSFSAPFQYSNTGCCRLFPSFSHIFNQTVCFYFEMCNRSNRGCSSKLLFVYLTLNINQVFLRILKRNELVKTFERVERCFDKEYKRWNYCRCWGFFGRFGRWTNWHGRWRNLVRNDSLPDTKYLKQWIREMNSSQYWISHLQVFAQRPMFSEMTLSHRKEVHSSQDLEDFYSNRHCQRRYLW